jgi:hypothetical protein
MSAGRRDTIPADPNRLPPQLRRVALVSTKDPEHRDDDPLPDITGVPVEWARRLPVGGAA